MAAVARCARAAARRPAAGGRWAPRARPLARPCGTAAAGGLSPAGRRAGAAAARASPGPTVPASGAARAALSSPYCLDLRALVERLRQELPERPQRGEPIAEDTVARVTELLQRTRLNPREWGQHAVFRRGRYTRNIVGYSPNQFVALVLCWERGQQSAIHDHSGAHCFVKMLSGRLREERFGWSGDSSEGAGSEVTFQGEVDASRDESSVCFMHDSIGLHRISNPSSENVAVSLHIYSPPFSECLVFPPTGAPPRVSPMVAINSPIAPSASRGQARGADPWTVAEMCTSLSALAERSASSEIDATKVLDMLSTVELSPMEWASYASPAQFSEFHCVQNLIHCDSQFSVMVFCFGPGQAVPRHTVGHGRRAWVKVMHGGIRYEEFAPGLFPWESGAECQSELTLNSCSLLQECAVRMHSYANASESEPAVMVQVFSPPLTQFTYRTEKGVERRDVPALLGAASCGCRPTDGGGDPEAGRAALPLPAASMRALMHTKGRWYLSFRGLAALLDDEMARGAASHDAVTGLLRKAVFNPDEWRARLADSLPLDEVPGRGSPGPVSSPKRYLLAQRPHYTLVLTFWGHHGHAHCTMDEEPGTASWTLVLEGELEERTFSSSPGSWKLGAGFVPSLTEEEPSAPARISTLKEESITFLGGADGRVRRCCDADVPCVSLHLYSPALPFAAGLGPPGV